MINTGKKIYHHFASDSLYRNSIYLMATTFLGAFVGFLFWMINARLFTSQQIGLATALISSTTLISGLSMVGLNIGIIRYLPNSKRKIDKINTVSTVIFLMSFLISVIYIFELKILAPKLLFIQSNAIYIILFVLAVVALAFENVYNSTFIAYRETKYILYKGIISNIFKVVSPFLLLALGTYAIFISATFGSIITLFLSIIILSRNFGFRYRLSINKNIFSKMFKLSLGNYVASFVGSLPLTLLPIMITNTLGARHAAYFYIDIMFVNFLNVIQSSLNQSLFAEGSTNSENLKGNIIKSTKFIILLLIPAILIIFFFGKYILLAFGEEYSNEGILLLKLLALSTIFSAINGTLSAIFNVKNKVNVILAMCVVGTIIILPLLYISLPYGLDYLGLAWIIGEGLITLIYCTYTLYFFKRHA